MADYNNLSRRTKNALKAIMEEVQYNGEQAFQAVLDNTTGEHNGYPILRILPGDYTTDKAAVASNDRTITFVFRVHLPLENRPATESATYDKMYDLTDLILDTLDAGDFRGKLTEKDPDLPTWILNTTRGDWLVNQSNGGVVLMCDVNVEVKYSRDFT